MRPLASPLILHRSRARGGTPSRHGSPSLSFVASAGMSVLRINQSKHQIKPPLIESD